MLLVSGVVPRRPSTTSLSESVVTMTVSVPAPGVPSGSVKAKERATAPPLSIVAAPVASWVIVVMNSVWPALLTTIRSWRTELTAAPPSLRVCQRMVIGPPDCRLFAAASSTVMSATRRSGSGGKAMVTAVAVAAMLFAASLSGWIPVALAWTRK